MIFYLSYQTEAYRRWLVVAANDFWILSLSVDFRCVKTFWSFDEMSLGFDSSLQNTTYVIIYA